MIKWAKMALLLSNILCKLKYLGMWKNYYLADICISIEINVYNILKNGGREVVESNVQCWGQTPEQVLK